jgi:outer membrane lipase/esterase
VSLHTAGRWIGFLFFVALISMASGAELPFTQFVVFGDSVSDTGNLPPSGPNNAPPNYTANRYTDGPDTIPSTQIQGVWHEQLATDVAIPIATPSTSGGTNFAYYGAVTNANDPTFLSLQQQVTQYVNLGQTGANSLYLFWGGANDITNVAPSTNVNAYTSAAANAVQNIQAQIGDLYKAGGRNFLWVNLPSFDKVPSGIGASAGVQAGLAAGSQTFNADYAAALTQLKQQYPLITITSVDAFTLFNDMIGNPGKYGFTNVTDNARADYLAGNTTLNPDQYLFWNEDHMTTAADNYIAQNAADALAATYATPPAAAAPEPESLALLGAGFTLLGLLRLRKSR